MVQWEDFECSFFFIHLEYPKLLLIMKPYIFMLLFLTASFSYGQTYNAYVSSSAANFRNAPTLNSEIHQRLLRHTNITVTDTLSSEKFASITHNGKAGFIAKSLIKPGKAVVSMVNGGRTGARCRDGSYSSATGRGACSHHGGVSTWIYSKRKNVEIIPNN